MCDGKLHVKSYWASIWCQQHDFLACAGKTTFLTGFGAALAHAVTLDQSDVEKLLDAADLKDADRKELLQAFHTAVCGQYQAISFMRWVGCT